MTIPVYLTPEQLQQMYNLVDLKYKTIELRWSYAMYNEGISKPYPKTLGELLDIKMKIQAAQIKSIQLIHKKP